jgi:hypothetical protein
MSMARHTSKSVTAMGWHHVVRSDTRSGEMVCEAWTRSDLVEASGASDFELRRNVLAAIELVEAEAKAGHCLV